MKKKRFKLIICENYEDVPDSIKIEVDHELTNNILERFDNPDYHNEDIIHNTLAEFGYKLKD